MSDGKVKHEELLKLRGYIEENLRATEKAGFKFIDTRGLKERIKSKQNHVIFGRRGSGKSTLLQELRLNGIHSSYIDLENHKDITFPNIVLRVLMDLLDQFNQSVTASIKLRFLRKFGSFHKYHRLFISLYNELRKLKDEPDLVSEKISSKQGTVVESSAKAGVSIKPISTSLSSSETEKKELETIKNVEKSKIEFLKNRLADIKNLLNLGIPLLKGNDKYYYLILDDFYFIPINDQPFLIDHIHRLTKGTDLFFKVATIRHRTKLSTTAQTYFGVEIGSDAVEIDLDYTFDDFQNLQQFMRQLLNKAITESDADLLLDNLFSGEGFKQLCIASGGVPRDFLSIFVKSVTKSLIVDGIQIGKVQVTEEAIANLSNKTASIRRDSGSENQLLELFAYDLRDIVFGQNRTNCFLVPKEQLEKNIQIKQAIRELFDLRLIHILDKNTSSAPSDGKMYEAYLIDIGLYENTRRPRNFKLIEPGQSDSKSRKDDVRSSPRMNIDDYHKKVIKDAEENGVTKELTITVQN